MKGLNRKLSRDLAYANIKLEGYRVSEEFKDIYEDFANNRISQLEALNRFGIDLGKVPVQKLAESSKTYMSDTYRHVEDDE
jgi:hypothetical protein